MKKIPSAEIVILVPTINEVTLQEVLSALDAQHQEAKILILGYGEASELAQKFNAEFVDFHQKTPKSIMLNYAIQQSTQKYFIILDADAIPTTTWFAQMHSLFEQGNSIFSGAINLNIGNFWMKVYNYSLLHEFSSVRAASYRKHLAGFSLGFTKEFFVENGGFDELLLRSQDYEWTLRAYASGHKLFFSPKPAVNHLPINKATLKSVMKYWYNAGVYNWEVRKKFENILKTPKMMNSPWVVYLTAPLISLIPIFRLIASLKLEVLKRFYLLPWIYLTKIAWCWGVFYNSRRRSIVQ